MDFSQLITVATVVIANVGTILILYCHTDRKIDEYRKESRDIADQNRIEFDRKTEEYRRETLCILNGIREEMKDFHGRLCAIEERNRSK